MKYFGCFALVFNQSLELFTSLEYYRLREKIEELFADSKGPFDSRRPQVWYLNNLRGRQFVQFIGLGYYCFIAPKMAFNWTVSVAQRNELCRFGDIAIFR